MFFTYRHVLCSTSHEISYWLSYQLRWPMICWSSILSSAFIIFFEGPDLVSVNKEITKLAIYNNASRIYVREQLRRIPFLVKMIFNLVTGMHMIVFYTHCSSMIPERIIEIKYIARDHIHNRISNPLIMQDALFNLKEIVKAIVLHISAWVCPTSLEISFWLPSELHWSMIC